MAQQIINIGTAPGDKTGDGARVAFDKVNDNFTELYASLGLPALTKQYNVVAHGFADFDPVQMTGAGWDIADAAAEADSDALGLIKVVDADNFYVYFFGVLDGFVGLTQGTTYWLDFGNSKGGGMANLRNGPPGAAGIVRKPMFKALSSTEAFIQMMPGWNSDAEPV